MVGFRDDPEIQVLSVVHNHFLLTVRQEEDGVFFNTSNLNTGCQLGRFPIQPFAVDLIPPMKIEMRSPENAFITVTFHVKYCESRIVSRYELQFLDWNFDKIHMFNTIVFNSIELGYGERALFIHKKSDALYPTLITSWAYIVRMYTLDDSPQRPQTPVVFGPTAPSDRYFCVAFAQDEMMHLADNRLARFSSFPGDSFDVNDTPHFNKTAVSPLMMKCRGMLYFAITREHLFIVDEVKRKFNPVRLPPNTILGAGLCFDSYDQLIVTDEEGRNPRPLYLPWHCINLLPAMPRAPVQMIHDDLPMMESSCKINPPKRRRKSR